MSDESDGRREKGFIPLLAAVPARQGEPWEITIGFVSGPAAST